MSPIAGYRVLDPVRLWGRIGGYRRREEVWVGKGTQEKRGQDPSWDWKSQDTELFLGSDGSWAHIDSEFTSFSPHCKPGEWR